MQIFVTAEEKVFSLGKFNVIATGARGPYPPSWFTKIRF